ncbi:MAG: TRAP transporter small permease [Sphingobacteriia bacterium]|nr:TRAP transporter small permease [Sphingobacteriia bacterium]
MQTDTIALDSLLVLTPPARQALPRWLSVIDSMVIAVLNVGLMIEVGLVFASTISRTFFNSSLLMGVDETAYLYLVVTAFMGGAVSYGRGEFVAITMLVEKMAPRFRNTAAAVVEWVIISISLLFGGYAIPLLLSNLEEKTLLLDISYFWMTAPIMAGSALFVLHAGLTLSRMRWVAVVAGMSVVVTFLLLAALTAQAAWVFTPWFSFSWRYHFLF